jgi:hypothetical protein
LFDWIGAAVLHERTPGLARHDLLNIPAQRVKAKIMSPNEICKVLGGSQENVKARSLQFFTKHNAWLNIASGTCRENRDAHDHGSVCSLLYDSSDLYQ